MNRRLRRAPVTDSGASLLITLAFVTFVGLVAAAMLGFSGTSLHAALTTKERSDLVYDADGALKTGINQVRYSTFVNDPLASACDTAPDDTTTNVLSYTGSNATKPVAVTCEGGPGTGVAGGLVQVSSNNKPGQALLVLGSQDGESLHVEGNNDLNIKGKVFLNGATTTSHGNGKVVVQNAGLVANGTCTPTNTFLSTPTPDCKAGNSIPADPELASPAAYAIPVPASGELSKVAVPACPSSGWLVTLSPGYYDDVTKLNDLTDGHCGAHTIYFQPGNYYFDFRNGDGAPYPSGTSHEWTIQDSDTRVVGGTPDLDVWNPASSSEKKPTLPGACVSPFLSNAANAGVAFVFGGDSRVDLKSGQMELCGQYYTNRPPIAVYGAKTTAGATTAAPRTDLPGTAEDVAAPSTFTTFANKNRILTADTPATDATSASADINRTATTAGSAAVVLKDFGTGLSVPKGAVLTAASLTVVHKENVVTNGLAATPFTVTVTPSGGTATSVPTTGLQRRTSYTSESVDLLPTLRQRVYDQGLTSLQAQYAVNVAAGGRVTAYVDYVQLNLTWTPPYLRNQSIANSCIVKTNNQNCPMFTSSQGPAIQVYFQGTTYAPNAVYDISLNNKTGQVFRWGLIVRALKLTMTGSFSSPDPVIEVPDNSPGAKPTDVYFKAYTCPDGGCTVSANTLTGPWKLAVTSRVQYSDDDSLNPSPGHRKVKVLSWTTYRG